MKDNPQNQLFIQWNSIEYPYNMRLSQEIYVFL